MACWRVYVHTLMRGAYMHVYERLRMRESHHAGVRACRPRTVRGGHVDRGEGHTYLRADIAAWMADIAVFSRLAFWSGPILSVAVAMPGEIAPTGIVCALSDSSCGEPRLQWLMPGGIAPKFPAQGQDSE